MSHPSKLHKPILCGYVVPLYNNKGLQLKDYKSQNLCKEFPDQPKENGIEENKDTRGNLNL